MSEKATTRDYRQALGLSVAASLLLLGMIGAWVYGSLRQQWAVEQLGGRMTTDFGYGRNLDGTTAYLPNGPVVYDYQLSEDLEPGPGDHPPGPAWLRDRLGIDFVASARAVYLDEDASDEQARALAGVSGLRRLDIYGAVSPYLLQQVSRLRQLERLEIVDSQIDDDALAILCKLPRLRTLDFTRCPRITDRGLDQLASVAALRDLSLSEMEGITEAGLARLGRLANLARLSLWVRNGVSGRMLEKLQSLQQLRGLSLYYFDDDAPPEGLKFLGGMPKLTELIIGGNKMLNDETLSELPVLSNIVNLRLQAWPGLHAAGVAHLAERFSNLEVLYLEHSAGLGDEGLQQLQRLSKLTRLTVIARGFTLTDEGLASLAALGRLKHLSFMADIDRPFSPATIETLQNRLPGCVVYCIQNPNFSHVGESCDE